MSNIWNIFYHMYLDAESQSILITQCKKLVELSTSMDIWRGSPYASYLRFSTDHTLTEVRRHWVLYAAMPELSARRQKAIRAAFEKVFKHPNTANMTPLTSARSAGPLLFKAVDAGSNQAWNYWKTGTTFLQKKDLSAAKLLNPTFAYSLSGEGCAVHYATDPLTTFHYAALFGNAHTAPSAADMVRTAQEQFSDWCTAVLERLLEPSTCPRIRFLLAEVTAACRALMSFGATGTLDLGVPVAQFQTRLIRLDNVEYVEKGAPASFNVIESSNLIDHVGLLNILIAAVPLMSSSPSSVLYTESLLFRGEDATKEFAELLYADIGTMALLLDLCPVDYLCGFTSRSNTHEIMMHQLFHKRDKRTSYEQTQFHQVTVWRSPASCDSVVALHGARARVPPVFDSRQLGNLLYDVYHAVFEQEDAMTFWRQNQQNMLRAIASSNMIHYMRESFVLLLKLVRERLQIPHADWLEVMDRLFELEQEDGTMPMNSVNRNDFYAHLHRQGVYTVKYYKDQATRIGPYANWDVVPPVVRIVLSVPREKITAFEDILADSGVGTPLLQCDVAGIQCHNVFAAIHVAYGRVITLGSPRSPRVVFEEDPQGRQGNFPLVVSFVLSAYLLTEIESPGNLTVGLCVRSTTGTALLTQKLGIRLDIFRTSLLDNEHVCVLPEQPLPAVRSRSQPSNGPLFSPNATLSTQIGKQSPVSVELDEQCELVSSLLARIDIEDQDVIHDFGSGAMPEVMQASPCVMRLTVADHSQDVVFPFPVVGSQFKLRLARKSRYIEVITVVLSFTSRLWLTHASTDTSADRWTVPQAGWHETQPIPGCRDRCSSRSMEHSSSKTRSAPRPQPVGLAA